MVNQQLSPHNPFRIGLDLDHTILEYIPLAHRLALDLDWISPDVAVDKLAIKRGLIQISGDPREGEIRWQKLQAMIFGKHVHEAALFDGFEAFIRDLRGRDCELFIVSHKTETSRIDPQVKLREWALETLERRGFFKSVDQGGLGFARDHVFFEGTRAEKVARIKAIDPHVFIDDLPSVLEHVNFPESTQPILFGENDHGNLPRCSDYRQALNLDLPNLRVVSNGKLRRWELIKRGGNNLIIRLDFQGRERVVVKRYFQSVADPRPRLDCEWKFLEMLNNRLPGFAPEPRKRLENGLVMTFVKGTPPQKADLLPMLVRLDQIGRSLNWDDIGLAAHARFRLSDFRKHADRRFNDLTEACSQDNELFEEALRFLKEDFSPVYHNTVCRFELFCHRENLATDKHLDRMLCFPSPSDFGLHNCLRTAGDDLVFVDFEYAGWDDPVKLLCDYLHHVGSPQPWDARISAIWAFIEGRTRDPGLASRFRAVCDLVGLEWILIVLNVLTGPELKRKQFAGASVDGRQLVRERLDKAKQMLAAFQPMDDQM